MIMVPGLALEVAELRAELASHRGDLAAAAGELLVPIPPPGSDMARVLYANALLRRRNARGNALANAARAWSITARAELARNPGSEATPEAAAIMDAIAELDAALGPIPWRIE